MHPFHPRDGPLRLYTREVKSRNPQIPNPHPPPGPQPNLLNGVSAQFCSKPCPSPFASQNSLYGPRPATGKQAFDAASISMYRAAMYSVYSPAPYYSLPRRRQSYYFYEDGLADRTPSRYKYSPGQGRWNPLFSSPGFLWYLSRVVGGSSANNQSATFLVRISQLKDFC